MQNKKLWLMASLLVIVILGTGAGVYMYSRPAPVTKHPVTPVQEKSVPASFSKEQSKTADQGTRVEPITEFRPGTVYSGTLGEVTSIQAGRDINKAAFEYKQYQLKLKELDDKLSEKPVIVPSLSLPPVTHTQGQPQAISTESRSRLVVMSVKGAGTLTATLRSRSGTYTVKVGDTVPGFGTVSSITRETVTINNSPLPWL